MDGASNAFVSFVNAGGGKRLHRHGALAVSNRVDISHRIGRTIDANFIVEVAIRGEENVYLGPFKSRAEAVETYEKFEAEFMRALLRKHSTLESETANELE